MERHYYVYILASRRNGTLYVGVTGDLGQRVWEHREGVHEGFTRKYGVKSLVHYEVFDDPQNAIAREKRLKKWNRAWKLRLIESHNPEWQDLYLTLNACRRIAGNAAAHLRPAAGGAPEAPPSPSSPRRWGPRKPEAPVRVAGPPAFAWGDGEESGG